MKYIIGIIATLVVVLVGAAAYYGAFTKIEVREQTIGPLHLLYEKNKGSYYQTRGSIEKLMAFAQTRNMRVHAGFGIFYDDPAKVAEADLRSEAGIIVDKTELMNHHADMGEFEWREYPVVEAVMVEFPFKGMPSFLIGIWRVYPILKNYLEEKKYKVTHSLEIYESGSHRTVYAFPKVRTEMSPQ